MNRAPARVGKIWRPEYTDLLIMVGPNKRWVEDDFEDLHAAHPEVFLGYRVLLLTVDQIRDGAIRGRRPERVVWIDDNDRYHGSSQAYQEMLHTLPSSHFPDVQWWHVHRVHGIYRTDLGS